MYTKENIFNLEANVALVRRLDKLTPESTHLWGKMNVSQMLRHCQKPLEVADGTLQIKRGVLGFLFGKMAKNSFLKSKQFNKNSPTAPEFKIRDTPDFTIEYNVLLEMITRFREKGPSVIKTNKHPFFGEMTDEEWGILNYKHLDHHLRQFGV